MNVENNNYLSDERLSKSINDYLNRPIYKFLTLEILESLPKEKLIETIFDNLDSKLGKKYLTEYRTVRKWSKGRQAIYIIWLLECEVNNGGYNQFFYNSSGKFYKHTPEMLDLVKAHNFAENCRKANKIYEEENELITKYQDGSLEGFSKSYEDNPLDVCDNNFFELYKKENLQDLQINYILNNKEEFIDKKKRFLFF